MAGNSLPTAACLNQMRPGALWSWIIRTEPRKEVRTDSAVLLLYQNANRGLPRRPRELRFFDLSS